MELDKKILISTLLKNPRIMDKVKELKLTAKQLEAALPIMIDMNKQQNDDEVVYLTSFFVTPNGSVKRTEVLSKKGKEMLFEKNIVSQHLYKLDFNKNDEYFKGSERIKLLSKFVDFLEKDQTTKGIYIYGPMGVGKTFTMKRFAKKLAQLGKKIAFINLPILVSKVKESFSVVERYEKIMSTLINADYLFVDDIGAETISIWFRDEFLFNILNTRMEKTKITFFSSNYSLEDLEKKEAKTFNTKYGDIDKAKRLLNRIKTLAEPVFLNGKNRRY